MIKKLRIDDITMDDRLQHRKADAQYVDQLREDMAAGADMPPVSVIYDGDKYWLWDGFNRVAAAKARNQVYVEADVNEGDYRAAWLASLGVNNAHGLRRKPEELHRIIASCFLDPVLSQENDLAISKLVNCSPHTVKKFRKRVEEDMGLMGTTLEESIISTLDSNSKSPLSGGASGVAPVKAMKALEKEKRRARKAYLILAQSMETLGFFDKVYPELTKLCEAIDSIENKDVEWNGVDI